MPRTKKTKVPAASTEDRFVFHHAAVALWKQDISSLRTLLAGLRSAGKGDLRARLLEDSKLLLKAAKSVKTVDVNESALRLSEASSKSKMGRLWDPSIDERSKAACIEMVCAVGEGRTSLQCRCSGRTVTGRLLNLLLKVEVAPFRDGIPSMLVSAIDEEPGQERSRMRALIDCLPDAVFMKDRDHRFVVANRSLAELMDAGGQEDLVGKSDIDYYPADRAASFTAEEKRVLEHGETLVNPAKQWQVNGSTRWITVTKIPLRDSENKIIGLVGVSHDVTKQKAAEDALAQERSYLTALMDNSTDYIYFKDLQSRFLLTNRAHANAFRLADPREAIGKTDFDFFSNQHAQAAFDDEQRIVRSGEPMINREEKETWRDRPDTWVSTSKLPLRDANGAIIGTFGISRDVTQQRHLEEKNLRLAKMVESSNDAIVGIDLEDFVTSWNSGAEKVFGYAAADMVGKPITSVIAPHVEERLPGIKDSLIRVGGSREFESKVTRKDGRQVYIASTLSLIQDDKGRIVGTTLISRDVTEQRALQAQVIRAQRLESLGTLASGIAHQFNNINAIIKGYLDIIMAEGGVPNATLSYTRAALKGVERSVEITDRLQNFSSAAQAGHEDIVLNDVVNSLLPLFEKQAREQGVDIRLDLNDRAVVRGSSSMLNFVITSLLSNSLHALLQRPDRRVMIRTMAASGYCTLVITDTGCGISAENLPRVFTPFFTTKGEWADPGSPQAAVKGIGLSLSVCQSTVAEHGGWIEVESVAGSGATFRVWLPHAEQQ